MKITCFALGWHGDKSASAIHFLIIKKKYFQRAQFEIQVNGYKYFLLLEQGRLGKETKTTFQLLDKT